MRRLNNDGNNRHNAFKELCASEEEVRELDEMASVLSSMDREEASPSFRAELKRGVLQESRREQDKRKTHPFRSRLSLTGLHPRSLVAAAAAGLLLIGVATYYVQGEVGIGLGALAPEQRSEGIALYDTDGEEEQKAGEDRLEVADPDEEVIDTGDPDKDTEDETGEPGEKAGDPGANGEGEPTSKDPGGGRPKSAEEEDKEKKTDSPDEKPDEDQPPREPDFDIWKEQRPFKVAGTVDLVGSNFESLEKGDYNVSFSYDPNRYVISIAEEDAQEFGTRPWAREVLSKTGFVVAGDDHLKVDTRDSQQGKFAEIYYKPRGSNHPTLYLYYQEGEGVHSLYYEERGAASDPGYYPLLSPAKAFEQAREMNIKSSSRLEYSLKEISLTYHEFLVEENGHKKKVTLPAYKFSGLELQQNKGEAKLFVPAVK